MEARIHYDDAAWEVSEKISDSWAFHILDRDIFQSIGELLLKHHHACDAIELLIQERGAFNIALRMNFYRTRPAIIRFPLPGSSMFPEEKVRNEVAVMRLIADKTTIPIPFIFYSGSKKESPGLAPFIIMEYVEHHENLVEMMRVPGQPKEERPILNKELSRMTLKTVYTELASVLLRLFSPILLQDKIGSICQLDDFTWEVAARPLSMPMNELIQLGSLPQSKLPNTTFNTASSYFKTLADLHIDHLINQRNDSIHSADDCRRKFVARFLFRKIIRDHGSEFIHFENGPFPLWCDDFRPANVLVDADLKITGVVDWEFTYAAPVEFAYSPPWWLILEKPEIWREGLHIWCSEYEEKLEIFLEAMADCEEKEQRTGKGRLSDAMRKSWETGDFWIMYAARNSFAFDGIYWQRIDERFFGSPPCDDYGDIWKDRLHLLEPEERVLMEKQVQLKLKQMEEERVLVWEPDEDTLAWMPRMDDEPPC